MYHTSYLEFIQRNCYGDAVIQLITRMFNRIQLLEANNNEPEHMVKIMCYILLHGSDDDDILNLAFTSNSNLISRINDAKVALGMSSSTNSGADPFEHPYSLYNQESDSGKRSSSSPRTICHYFMKGYCKFGEKCRFDHPKNYAANEHRSTTPRWALERLETEIVELLRSRNGRPVSIALLPTLYSAKYGKALHADGYLTESQRRGNVGYSLTTLLSCLRNSIRVVDRPHGQHSVVLAEDAAKYAKCRSERSSEMSAATTTTTTTCSNQIYLTFSAKSKFTDEDVAAYFKQFGPVRNVRIPCQDERMFGFVCFCNANTVDEILRNRKPHYICGDRVLVKPYRENSRDGERLCMKKTKPGNYNAYHQYLHPSVGSRLSEFRLDSMTHLPFVSYNTKPVNEFQWKDNIRYEFGDSNCRPGNDDENAEQAFNSCSDQERSQIELPESPFSLECRFSTVI